MIKTVTFIILFMTRARYSQSSLEEFHDSHD